MCNKLVSVIMPTFNSGQYLKYAVESILDQTYQNLELLVIDDHSVDSTMDILNTYSKKDNRISIFHNPGKGIASALNYGIDLAKGEYIARMDSDDIAVLDRIETQVFFLEENPDVGICSTQIQMLLENGSYGDEVRYPEENDSIKLELINDCSIAHPTVMFRSQIMKGKWHYNAVLAEDYDLWTRMVITERFCCLSKKLLYYRVHSNNASKMIDNDERNRIISGYVKNLFILDVSKYKKYDFYVSEDIELIGDSVQCYLFRQYQLLKEMYMKNLEYDIFDKIIMKDFVNQRWLKVWRIYEFDLRLIGIENNFDFEILLVKTNDEVKQIFDEITKKIKLLFCQHRKFVIYGLGNFGEKLLKCWEQKKSNSWINWELIALSDKKKKLVTINSNSLLVIKPEVLTKIEFDYVLVSSKIYYEEIKRELILSGIEGRKIFYAGAIFEYDI